MIKLKLAIDYPRGTFLRECQECGHYQPDSDPHLLTGSAFETYSNRKCRRCKSEALDYGSVRIVDDEDIAEELR